MASNADEYRQRATHCLMLAAEAHHVSEKMRFEALAQSWMKLASDLEMQTVLAQVAAVKSWRGRPVAHMPATLVKSHAKKSVGIIDLIARGALQRELRERR